MPDVVEVVRSERPQVGHLVRRFFGALSTAAPSVEDAAWADAMLTGPERAAFAEMANHDRRHAIGVARRALAALGPDADDDVAAAALLHDVRS